jgi:hypothetical protein
LSRDDHSCQKRWFRALVPGGHAGAGRVEERLIYLYAATMADAHQILNRKAGSWKQSKGVTSLRVASTIESDDVELWIKHNVMVPLAKIKKSGFVYVDKPSDLYRL